jgi:hypothetical protein
LLSRPNKNTLVMHRSATTETKTFLQEILLEIMAYLLLVDIGVM